MPRVMFVMGSLAYGGAERHAITVMNRLEERGHDCHAVYIKSGAEQLNRLRLRDGATGRCLDAVRYFDRRALADLAGHIADRASRLKGKAADDGLTPVLLDVRLPGLRLRKAKALLVASRRGSRRNEVIHNGVDN